MVTRIDAHRGPKDQPGLVSIHRPEEIHIATVNVRLDRYAPQATSNDPYAERPWSERKTRLVDALLGTGELDIIGFQEVLHNQLLDLVDLLGPTYSYVGVGRDDGKEAGEYSPIFYDKRKYSVVKWGTVWLSPTPEVPGSKGWDAALPRIATLATFRPHPHSADRLPGTSKPGSALIHAVCTHYDHQGLRARAESSLLIRSQIWRWVKKVEDEEKVDREGVVVLFGDFNSPSREKGYKNITSSDPIPSGQPSFTFLDSFVHLQTRKATSHSEHDPRQHQQETPAMLLQTGPYGPANTYTDFAPPGARQAERIDFVMVASNLEPAATSEASDMESEKERQQSISSLGLGIGRGRGGWAVTRYACLDNFVEGDHQGWTGRWSDHRAVRVTLSQTSHA
ncbi:hypothetical protein IAU59_000533 [Kwoniella sp. CBS 9459]